jgi:hypothetical protein
MSAERELSRLFEAERREDAASSDHERGWQRLESTLAAGTPPMAVSLSPLKLGVPAAAKWGAGAGIVALVAGGAMLAPESGEPPRSAPAPTVSAPVATLEPPPLVPTASPSETSASLPERPAPSSSAERDASFGEEVRLIKLAKGEIDGGRPHLAEVWLDEHARRFPNGVFRTERTALGILVACSAHRAHGERGARDFVRTNPRSPLVDRIARACGLGEMPAPGASRDESKREK